MSDEAEKPAGESPKMVHRQPTKQEMIASKATILRWLDSGLYGKELIKRIMEEFQVAENTAYYRLKKAEEYRNELLGMDREALRKYCHGNYVRLSRHPKASIVMAATDRLAKRAGYFPAQEHKHSHQFEGESLEDLEKLAKEKGLDV